MATADTSLPRGWTNSVRASVLHAVSVAFTTLTRAWGSAATSRSRTTRLEAELDRTKTEVALLTEELRIKSERLTRVPARRRPHYRPVDRMRILELKAARGWSTAQTAAVFAVTEDTVAAWLRRADDQGGSLLQTAAPVNKYPDFVGYLVCRLKALCPSMGKTRIAQVLALAGLHLGATTVGRMLRQQPHRGEPADEIEVGEAATSVRTNKAKRPDHIWHVDLTSVPTAAGFWVPWLPFSKVQRWPFCWWVALVVDQFSRRVVGFALFRKAPTSTEVCQLLDRATKASGARPLAIITDQGRQFACATYKRWCRRRGVDPRFGKVGKHASIAVVERLIRSLKSECTRRILVPLQLNAMRNELALYATWYNDHRPHQALGGSTPSAIYHGSVRRDHRIETRRRQPITAQATRAFRLALHLKFVEGRRHLPIVELRRAA